MALSQTGLDARASNNHCQGISALAVDPNGARLLTGAYDYNLKMWDFAGMDANFRSFRTTTPCGSNRVRPIREERCGYTNPQNLNYCFAEFGSRGAADFRHSMVHYRRPLPGGARRVAVGAGQVL